MDTILTLVNKGNDFLWSFLLLILLCGTGIYYTIRLKFIQVRKFGEGCKHVFGHFSLNGEKHEKGEMSPFQSIMTAIAAQVGTGNLAGAATALFGGGPGAIFWMWLSAFFGMATIYSEAVLAQNYKTEVNGEVTGGPVYYIKAAFKGNFGKVLSTRSVLRLQRYFRYMESIFRRSRSALYWQYWQDSFSLVEPNVWQLW